jgi:hypothetical protein
MSNDVDPDDRPVSSDLHPLVYMLIAALALWFVVSVWSFAGAGDTDYLLVVVSGFIFVAVALPFVLWRVGRRAQDPDDDAKRQPSFRDWASTEFDTWQDRLPGANASIEILLPIAAIAFGMTAFGIVLHFTAHGAV